MKELDHGMISVRLSKAFILASVHGPESIKKTCQQGTIYIDYLPPVERSAVEKLFRAQ